MEEGEGKMSGTGVYDGWGKRRMRLGWARYGKKNGGGTIKTGSGRGGIVSEGGVEGKEMEV